jgi:molybdopterin-containing oxidoreductase family iron-sulfur binding subunit
LKKSAMSTTKPNPTAPRPPGDPPAAGPRWWRTLEEQASTEAARAAGAGEHDRGDDHLKALEIAGTDDGASRRDFFKVMGLSATAAMAACQRAPEQKILPFTYKPDEITPGLALWYASACGGCAARCGLLVKTRDGRPIKIEGNPSHPVSAGAVCAVGQASVLGLYDADRSRGPSARLLAGSGASSGPGRQPVSWKELDAAVAAALARTARDGGEIRLVVPWGLGPTEEAALDLFIDRAMARASAGPGAAGNDGEAPRQVRRVGVVRFDPMGQRDAIAAAHQALYGVRLVPEYRLDEAHVVAAFEADFLGTFVNPAALARQWSRARAPSRAPMLRHIQIEGNLSLTGGAADQRIVLPASAQVRALAELLRTLSTVGPSGGHGATADLPGLAPRIRLALQALQEQPDPAGPAALPPATHAAIGELAQVLAAAGPRALVMCGSDDPNAQLLTALVNAWLGNGETTARLDAALAVRPDELSLDELVAEVGAERVGALFFMGTNPAVVDARLGALVARVPFSLSTSERLDETAALVSLHAPQGHFLEGWTDHRPRGGVETLGQPCVAPLFDTRPATASLLAWAAKEAEAAPTDAGHAFLAARWKREVIANLAGADGSLELAWDAALREGVVVRPAEPIVPALTGASDDATATLVKSARRARTVAPTGAVESPRGASDQAFELALFASVALRDGTLATANNGWLQELPDPITKVTWGNHAALAPARAAALGLADGDVVELRTGGGASLRLPVLSQPGLAPSVVAVAVGHGRTRAGRIAAGHGTDVWSLAEVVAGRLRRDGIPVTVARVPGETRPLAQTQTHASQEGRELVRQVSLAELVRNPHAGNLEEGNPGAAVAGRAGAGGPRKRLGLWSGHAYEGHRWGLSIDLNRCTGCGACVVSCSAENNVPIVGETEVRRRREMHWLRIDRYYGGTPEAPEVLHQPMMCQHCENAPCETVCPVVATVHSSEGLNQQVYNRCVGTRYCANNCPTKVRRFNWFDYDHGGDLARMVLNPDVVVRSRGVMEKCSMCVQRIEEARALTRREGRVLADGDIRTACQQSCPGEAITFGDSNDGRSALSEVRRDPRTYTILEEINVKPQVSYLVRVKNAGAEAAAAGAASPVPLAPGAEGGRRRG